MLANGFGNGTARKAIMAGLMAWSVATALPACSIGGASTQGGASSTQADAAGTTGQLAADDAGQGASAPATAALRTEAEIPTDGSPLVLIGTNGLWTERDLDGSWDASSATAITLSGATAAVDGADADAVTVGADAITISGSGTYVLTGSGSLPVVIDDGGSEEAKVQLVLDDASISVDGYAAIYARSADKVFLTLAGEEGSELATAGELSQRDDREVDGAVFSRCDLTVNGDGSLWVSGGEHAHGIVCKDDLRLVSGDVAVSSGTRHAVQAEGSVAIRDGRWSLSAGKDGIHSEHDDDATKGWACIEGGEVSIEAGSDGIDSASWLQVDGGDITVSAADDGLHAELDLAVNGGRIDVTQCEEGVEGGTVTITAGEVAVKAEDDGINATGDGSGGQGAAPASQGDEGDLGAQGGQQPSGVPEMPEGQGLPEMPEGQGLPEMPEGQELPEMPGGQEPPEMPDDWQPGTDSGQRGGGDGWMHGDFGATGMMGSDASAILTISGGSVTIDAYGDGIDSNGLLHLTGGTTLVSGPLNDGNSAIDAGTECRIDGGTLLAAGSSGMFEGISGSSSQPSVVVFLDEAVTGDVSVSAADGGEGVSMPAAKGYSCVVASLPGMSDGDAYVVTAGGASQEVTLSGTVTQVGEAGGWQRPELSDGFVYSDEIVGMRFGDGENGDIEG